MYEFSALSPDNAFSQHSGLFPTKSAVIMTLIVIIWRCAT